MPPDLHPLEELLRERIVVLDGAMGTMIQRYKLSEADYRGGRFRDWKGKDLKGSLELLLLTRPEISEEIHAQYLEAGADIIETNTFSATTIGLHDFLFREEPANGRKDRQFFQRVVDDVDLRALMHEMNVAAATIARRAADRAAKQSGSSRFVAGSIGPLPVTASISPDVNDPSFRAVTFDQLRQAYFDQVRALVEGGVDLLIVETIFDTLNAKAALFAGLNCALGPDEMEAFIEELARVTPFYVSAYPNAGLPDPLSETGFPETPETLAPKLKTWAENGWLNIVGGCCGTTPAHIRAIANAVRDCKPRAVETENGRGARALPREDERKDRARDGALQLSGFEPLNVTPEMGFV